MAVTTNAFVRVVHGLTCPFKSFDRNKKNKKLENRKRKKKKISLLTGYHHKPTYYRGTVF